MNNQVVKINRVTVAFQLNEALEGIRFSRSEVRNVLEEPVVWVELMNVLGHLCVAWHRKHLGPDEIMKESEEEYELRSTSVPNWGGSFRLVDLAAVHSAMHSQMSHGRFDRETVCNYLSAAEVDLQGLMYDVEDGKFDARDISLLGERFGRILNNLCLAWHLRYSCSAEITALEPTLIQELASWLPLWQWDLRLVPADLDVSVARQNDLPPKNE